MSKRVATTMAPSTKVLKINAMLLRAQKTIDPETGLEVSKPLSEEKLEETRKFSTGAVGIDWKEVITTVSSARSIDTRGRGNMAEIPLVKNLIKQQLPFQYPL